MNAGLKDKAGLIPVVATVIFKKAAYLFCKRPAHKRHGNLWEFPGGKIKTGESIEEAARRELKEELQVELTSLGNLLYTAQDPGSPFLIHFVEVDISGEPKTVEHQEIRWFKVNDLYELDLAPADAEFVREKILSIHEKRI